MCARHVQNTYIGWPQLLRQLSCAVLSICPNGFVLGWQVCVATAQKHLRLSKSKAVYSLYLSIAFLVTHVVPSCCPNFDVLSGSNINPGI